MIFNFNIKELTPNNIYDLVSDIDIYEFYLKDQVNLSKKYHSPFREDKNPSLSFVVTDNNKVLWRDWGDAMQSKPEDAFSFVMKLFNCNFTGAMRKVNQDLNLGLDGERVDVMRINRFKPRRETLIKKRYTTILVERSLFKSHDIAFWDKYHISVKTLSNYNVYPIDRAWVIKGGKVSTSLQYTVSNPIYAYEFSSYKKKCYKLYSPYDKKYKWMTNCPESIVQGYYQLDWFGDILIITKSLKDVMVLREMGYNSIAPQSETSTIDVQLFNSLLKRFNKIVLLFDNDKTGKKRSEQISKELGINYFLIPEDKAKDISDYVRDFGFDEGKKLIKQLLNE